jgi:glutaconate CoA-transferase, subunit A
VVPPSLTMTAVCEVRDGAFPSYALGYYQRNNSFYQQWDEIARERERFTAWIERHVIATADFAEFRQTLQSAGSDGRVDLKTAIAKPAGGRTADA